MNFHFPYIFYYAKNSVQIGFPMPTAKNGFQILNPHPKKHTVYLKKKNSIFLDVISRITKK